LESTVEKEVLRRWYPVVGDTYSVWILKAINVDVLASCSRDSFAAWIQKRK